MPQLLECGFPSAIFLFSSHQGQHETTDTYLHNYTATNKKRKKQKINTPPSADNYTHMPRRLKKKFCSSRFWNDSSEHIKYWMLVVQTQSWQNVCHKLLVFPVDESKHLTCEMHDMAYYPWKWTSLFIYYRLAGKNALCTKWPESVKQYPYNDSAVHPHWVYNFVVHSWRTIWLNLTLTMCCTVKKQGWKPATMTDFPDKHNNRKMSYDRFDLQCVTVIAPSCPILSLLHFNMGFCEP